MVSRRQMDISDSWHSVGPIETGHSQSYMLFFIFNFSTFRNFTFIQTIPNQPNSFPVAGRPRVTTPANDRNIAVPR